MEQPSSASSRGLPIDVIVEITERSDPITLLRCAAACKQLRRAISGEGLRRELRLRSAAGFVPVLLRGFYYQPRHGSASYGFLHKPIRFVHATAGGRHGQLPAGDASGSDTVQTLALGFEPVAARGGFVLARTDSSSGKVCNPMTGYVRSIPLPRKDLGASYLLLTADDGVVGASSDDDSKLHSFRLLAVQLCQPTYHGRLRVKVQALTPVTGRWCPTTKIPVHGGGGGGDRHQHPGAELLGRPPVVVNGVAYFLGVSHSFDHQHPHPHPPSYYFILRVDVSDHGGDGRIGTKAATIMPAPDGLKPPSCSRCTSSETAAAVVTQRQLLLAPSHDRNSVALLVGRRTTRVEIYTLDLATSVWACATKVDTAGVRWRPCDLSESEVELLWSGEASGAVLFRLGGTVCQLDRATMAIRALDEEFPEFRYRSRHTLLPYEMGLSSWVPSISA